jgi:hypothetical protein
MNPTTPAPVAKSLLLCREIFEDARTHQYILVGPSSDIRVFQVPCVMTLAVYAEVTSGHGAYRPSLQLRDAEDRPVWTQNYDRPFTATDPLRVASLAFFDVPLCIPALGHYDLVLLADGEEVTRRGVSVSLVGQPGK